MKKFLSLASLSLAFLFVGFAASAQQTMTASKDSSLNADNVYLTAKIVGYHDVAAFQIVQTKTSGTVAGKVYMQGSIDGINYLSFDSLTLADQAINTKIFTDIPSRYTYYRMSINTTGTQLSRGKGYYLYRSK